MRPDTTFALENMPSKNQGLYVPFCYEIGTTFTLQNMLFQNQDLSVPLSNETEHCFYFPEHTL